MVTKTTYARTPFESIWNLEKNKTIVLHSSDGRGVNRGSYGYGRCTNISALHCRTSFGLIMHRLTEALKSAWSIAMIKGVKYS